NDKKLLPQLSRFLESFGLKVFHLKSSAAQSFCCGTNRLTGFCCDWRAAIIFKITNSQFFYFTVLWPADGDRRRAGVANVWTLHHLEQNFQVGNCACHWADDADQSKWPRRCGIVAGRRNSPRRWLQTADAAEVSGHANGTSTVAAHSARRHARGNGRRFAAAGAAGRALQIPRAVGATVEQVIGFPCHKKLGSIGCTQYDRARVLQACHQRRILRRDESLAQPTSCFATQAGDAD